MAAPGVPDTYAGTERWRLDLVDPDNRRAVDYGVRRDMLAAFAARDGEREALLGELLAAWPDGRVKLYLTWRLLQLRRAHSGERVLPVFASDNYISLVPNETRTITLDAAIGEFKGEDAQVVVDGWNVTVASVSASGVSIAPNVEAQPDHWPTTGLPYQTVGLR